LVLYQILTQDAYRALRQRGRLEGYARNAWRHFLPAYAWMARQMAERIGPPSGRSKYPVWAWHTWSKPNAVPDLRVGGHLPRGTKGYRLTLEVPEGKVVLSDFDLWHYCLNGWHLAKSAAEDRRVARMAKGLLPDEWQAMKEHSWQYIFDLSAPRTRYLGQVRSIQATLWRVDLDMVRSVQAFVGR
jgi:hypothetical protein